MPPVRAFPRKQQHKNTTKWNEKNAVGAKILRSWSCGSCVNVHLKVVLRLHWTFATRAVASTKLNTHRSSRTLSKSWASHSNLKWFCIQIQWTRERRPSSMRTLEATSYERILAWNTQDTHNHPHTSVRSVSISVYFAVFIVCVCSFSCIHFHNFQHDLDFGRL